MKKIFAIAIVTILAIVMSVSCFAADYAGVVETENGYIYINSSGKTVKDCVYSITKTNGLIDKGVYVADENGILTPYTGIYEGYFIADGQIAYGLGLISFNGGLVYVRGNGRIAIGPYTVTTVNDFAIFYMATLQFDANGMAYITEIGDGTAIYIVEGTMSPVGFTTRVLPMP